MKSTRSTLHTPAASQPGMGLAAYPSPHSHDLISAVEAAPAPSAYPVQMRLPTENARQVASKMTPNRDHDLGLRRLCARIYYHELAGAQRTQVRQLLEAKDITLADWQDFTEPTQEEYARYQQINQAMYNAIVAVAPEKVASDLGNVGKPEAKSTAETAYNSLVKRVGDTFAAMLTRSDDFQAVFGSKGGDAFARVKHAMALFPELVKGNALEWDASGAMEEMHVGGQTGYGKAIVLKSILGATYTDSPEQAATIIHEMMHSACNDIHDDGGYAHQAEFKTKSEAVKLLNAAHYEEVARRALGIASVGGTFTPAQQVVTSSSGASVVVDSRTPRQIALEDYKTRIRTAWICAQNLRNFMQSTKHADISKLHPNAVAALSAINTAFNLRIPTASNAITAAPSQTDVLQMESITKSLARMMSADISAPFADGTFADAKTAWVAAREILAQRFADPVWMTEDAWKAILPILETGPQNALEFKG